MFASMVRLVVIQTTESLETNAAGGGDALMTNQTRLIRSSMRLAMVGDATSQ